MTAQENSSKLREDYMEFLVKELKLDVEESDVNNMTAVGLMY